MTPEKFKKGIKELHRIGLTKAEKETILKNVMETPVEISHERETFTRPTISIWSVFMGYSRFSYALATIVILLVSGGSVMYASEKALPGDILYKVKVDLTEPLRDKFKRTPEARVEWEVAKATRRLKEAETLARENKLDEPRRVKLEQDFEKHSDKIDAGLKEIREAREIKTPQSSKAEGKEDKTEKIERDFVSAVASHKKILEDIHNNIGTPERGKKEIEFLKASINRKIERNRHRDKDEGHSDVKDKKINDRD